MAGSLVVSHLLLAQLDGGLPVQDLLHLLIVDMEQLVLLQPFPHFLSNFHSRTTVNKQASRVLDEGIVAPYLSVDQLGVRLDEIKLSLSLESVLSMVLGTFSYTLTLPAPVTLGCRLDSHLVIFPEVWSECRFNDYIHLSTSHKSSLCGDGVFDRFGHVFW